jgi:diguanylate cyclase (GGDEF)-like protein
MPLTVTAQALLGTALLLALGFHRNRAVQMFLVLAAIAAAYVIGDPRTIEGALRFGPWFLFAVALMPEARLWSRRNVGFLLALSLALGVVVAAPPHVFRGLSAAAGWLLGGLEAPRAAAVVCAAAGALCLARWAIAGQPMEFGLSVILVVTAAGLGQRDLERGVALLASSGLLGILAVLYASYRMAFIDGLTGLPNRRALDETLMRLGGHYALAMVDVDHFKQFNDSYGHDAGDLVLRSVGRVLRRHAGAQAFRYGGEEFCLVYEGPRVKQATEACERARQAVAEQRIRIAAGPKRGRRDSGRREKTSDVAVTISIGCAARGSDRRAALEVLKAADQALYRAKQKGRNRVVAA